MTLLTSVSPFLRRLPPAALLAALVLLPAAGCRSGQRANPSFEPRVERPEAAPGDGPRVLIDEAHGNFHRNPGRYRPFAELLAADGFRVGAFGEPFTAESLAAADVLVIANALAERNLSDWSLPTPSAFTAAEVAAVRRWVEDGGRLLLIADHMPFPGAAAELAAAFGVTWRNGFAFPAGSDTGVMRFTRAAGTLQPHPVTDGRDPGERVEAVKSFTGSAFRFDPVTAAAAPLLVLPAGTLSLEPERAWEFDETTPRTDVAGWLQGATVEVGEGRVALFGEAAMFTSQQTPDGTVVGMGAPGAEGNTQLLLNLLRWLAGSSPAVEPAG